MSQNDGELWNDLRRGVTFHMPNDYPNGIPLYWMHEASGVLAEAIRAFLGDGAFSLAQTRLVREYIAHWVNAPLNWRWGDTSQLEFVVRLDRAQNREDLWAILHELLDAGIDPL